MESLKNLSNEGSYDDLVKLINESETIEKLIEQAKEWNPNIEKYNIEYWTNNIFSDNIKKIDINKLPEVLDVFYKSTDKFTFMLFCMILESTIEELPYLTNLEKEKLFVAKWEILKETLCTIIKNTNSGLIDCMFLILLNNDPTGHYLTEKEKNDVIFGINNNLEGIYNYLSKNQSIEQSVYKSLEIILDTATYFNDNTTKNLLEKIEKLNLDEDSIIFLIKYQLINGLNINEKDIDKVLENKALNHKLFYVLDSIGKLYMLSNRINQEQIATSKMIEWLIYPTELGELPTDIKLIDTLEVNNLIYYLFKFKTNVEKFKDNDYMIGVVGGYEKDKLTTDFTGVVFSDFEKVSDDYKNQGIKIIQLIRNSNLGLLEK